MYDLVIVNGEVITSESKSFKDIAIKDGKIAEIVERGTLDKTQLQGAEVYDASGKCVIPGLVEPHMHIKAPLGGFTDILDFDSASKCAAFGGVTTFIDFTSTLPGDSLLKAVEDRKKEMAKAKLDYSCHCKVVNLVTTELASEANLAEVKFAKTKSDTDKKTAQTAVAKVEQAINDRLSEIPKIIKDEGIPTFKLFMTYRKANVMIDDTYMLKVLAEIKKYGGRCGFHAESNAIAEYNEELFAQKGTLDWKYFPECKNNLCEAEAVNRVLYYAKLLDVPPEAFSPAPKVDSAVVRLIPAKYRIGQAQDFEQFAALVKQAFHRRRKTIRNNLKGLADDNDLQAAGISPQERAEHIAPEKYVALANLLAQKAS